jgi:hypothetical protein
VAIVEEERRRRLALYRRRVDGYVSVDSGFVDRWRRWCAHLLSHGGILVVPPQAPEGDLDELSARATAAGPASRFQVGADNACHTNAAVLWIHGDVSAIGTGYALSDDDLWRQHSWGLDADGTIVETTTERRRYVGLRLSTGLPSLRFTIRNAPTELDSFLAGGGDRAAAMALILDDARTG